MAILRWNPAPAADPFEELDRLQEELTRVFGFPYRPARSGIFDRPTSPLVDFIEEPDHFTVLVDVPGLKKEDLEVNVVPQVLTIRGEKKNEEKKKSPSNRTFRDETWEGSFQRTLNLPDSADIDKISAELSDGVLRLEIPKKAELKPRQIAVAIKN
ncbi:MAG: Hsp20/alpha crystallin family protein [Spirochaetales bacterium]|nr:Hsp20/alpha crystallin family protein [Spirochaetales bacterium]